jgi:hypothetical protein
MSKQNKFRRVAISGLALLPLGITACGSSDGPAECPENFSALSIEVDSAAPVIQAFSSLARATVKDGITSSARDKDPYALAGTIGRDGDNSNFDTVEEVVCVDEGREQAYLTTEAVAAVGAANADGYVFDFEEGFITLEGGK